MADLSELLPFLEHERADVKLMAAEAVSQTAADPAAVAGLVAVPGMLKQLLRVSSGTDAAAAHAAAALVNICADEAARPAKVKRVRLIWVKRGCEEWMCAATKKSLPTVPYGSYPQALQTPTVVSLQRLICFTMPS